jgi:hypothetical protein
MLKNNRAAFTGAGVALGLAMLLSPAPNAQAATIAYTGTTVGGSTWNRPNDVLTTTATPPVAYSVQAFYVNAADTYSFTSIGTNPLFWDNYTFLYQGSFNAASPLTNAIAGNDNLGLVGVSGFSKSLATGTNYFLVTTGNLTANTGGFTNSIVAQNLLLPNNTAILGSVPTTPVPEPATVLGSIVAFGYSVHSRRKQKNAAAQSNETV